MKHACPECQQKLDEFAIRCDCGWELATVLDESINRGLAATAERKSQDFVVIPARASSQDDDARISGVASEDDVPLPVELQLTRARQLIEDEDFPRAIACINRALAEAPIERRAECLSLKGYTHYRLGELDKAEEACTKAITDNWEDARAFAWRAAARGEQNKWRLAFEDLHEACELTAPREEEYLQLMEKYAGPASQHFRETVKNGDATADTFCDRGWVYLRRGKLRKAERDFKHALSLNIDHRWAALGLALTHRQAGVVKHLEPLLNAAAEGPKECRRLAFETSSQINHEAGMIAATDHDLHHLHRMARGDSAKMIQACRLRARLGFPIRSIDILTKLLKKSPESTLGWLVRGECYAAIKSYSLACKDFTRFLNVYSDHVDALIARASTLLAMQKYNLGHHDIDFALEIQPTNYHALLIQAKLFLAQDRLDEALMACQAATRIESLADGFAVKAEIYHKLCNFTESFEEYSRAIELAREPGKKAEYLYRRGAASYELEKFEEAFDDFRQSCKLRPNHSGAWIWKAATCARLEKWHTAIKALQSAVDARPSAARQYRKLGRPVAEKAIEFFDQQEKRAPATQNLYRYRAMSHHFLGDFESALRDFSTACKRDPEDVELLIKRGQACAEIGDHERAQADLAAVIRDNPQHHLALYSYANSLTQLGRHDQSRSELKKAIKLAPDQAKYHLLLGQLCLNFGDKKKATRAFDKAIVRDPSDSLSYRRRASVYMSQGRYRQAIRDFSHAIELSPGQAEVLEQRGLAYLKYQQPELALEDFEAALVLNPKLPKSYRGRASVLVSRDKHEYVLIWLTKAIHRFEDPRDLVEILFARGKAFAQMGRWSPAISDFSSVINLKRDDPQLLLAARHARGLSNVQAGRFKKAMKDFKRIKRLLSADLPGDSQPPKSVQQVDQILAWLAQAQGDPNLPWLDLMGMPIKPRTPTRPPVIRRGVQLDETIRNAWQNEPPHDSWVVRTLADREYGPVRFGILTSWIEDGRIDVGMKLLRSDWAKWKRVERLFPDILPSNDRFVEDFPGIEI